MSAVADRFEQSGLGRRFRFAEYGTSPGRDTIAGITTFIVMSYIIFVNPAILGFSGVEGLQGQGLPFEAVLTSTCLVAGVMTIIMGLYTNNAYAIAPGLGLNAVVAFTLVANEGLTFPEAMGLIVVEGIAITILVLAGLRKAIMRAIPLELKKAIAIGIGLFIAFIGLYNSGLVTGQAGRPGQATPVDLAEFTTYPVLITIFGLVLTIGLRAIRLPGRPARRDRRHHGLRDDRQLCGRRLPGGARLCALARRPLPVAGLQPRRRVQLRRVHDAAVPRCRHVRLHALPRGLLRHDGDARRRRPAGRLPGRARRDARHPEAAAHRLARRGCGRRCVGVLGDDVHRVGVRGRRRRAHRLGQRHHRRALLPVHVHRAADRDGAAAGNGARADHRRLADDQRADRGGGRSRGRVRRPAAG